MKTLLVWVYEVCWNLRFDAGVQWAAAALYRRGWRWSDKGWMK